MKITTKGISITLLWLVFFASVHIVNISNGAWFIVMCASAVLPGAGVCITSLILIINSFDEEETLLTIPMPYAQYIAKANAKKELNKAITNKYVAMANAERHEFENLHNEAIALEHHLEKMEA